MIPATHWADSEDGTAWWVVEEPGIRDDGRHTFDVEVEVPEGRGDVFPDPGWFRTHRVSVVPGMVLPIVAEQDILNGLPAPASHVIARMASGEAWLVSGTDPIQRTTLPPAAKPGMWAIQLRKADR